MMVRTLACKARVAALMAACAFAFTAGALVLPATAHAVAVRDADVSVAVPGNCLLSVDGTFKTAGKDAVLKRINEIRKEACEQGVPKPGAEDWDTVLTASDYVPMRWSKDLETIAQTRAAESSLFQGHRRPNGEAWISAHQDLAVSTCAENIAWNYGGMLLGIEQWYKEKKDWVKRDTEAETGHYTSLIDPEYEFVGLGTFEPKQGGWAATVAEFCPAPDFDDPSIVIDEGETGVKGAYRQIIEVPLANITGLVVEGNSTFNEAGTCAFSQHLLVNAPSTQGTADSVKMDSLEPAAWTTSAAQVATVDASGTVTVKHSGTAQITARVMGQTGSLTVKAAPKSVKVKKLAAKKKALKVTWAENTSLTSGYQIRYSTKKSMSKAKTVTVKGAGKASKTIKKLKKKKRYYVQIRAYEKFGGKTYVSAWSSKKNKKTK